eukprot:6213200-Pleurochrysis_carterae.AAC.1
MRCEVRRQSEQQSQFWTRCAESVNARVESRVSCTKGLRCLSPTERGAPVLGGARRRRPARTCSARLRTSSARARSACAGASEASRNGTHKAKQSSRQKSENVGQKCTQRS